MHKILRDPLVHFLALVAVMFVSYSLLNPVDDVAGSNQIRITSGYLIYECPFFTAKNEEKKYE
jgi:hypothetical protein